MQAQAIEQINSFEYFHNLPSPSGLDDIAGITVPHLADLIARCVDLDLLFPADEDNNEVRPIPLVFVLVLTCRLVERLNQRT